MRDLVIYEATRFYVKQEMYDLLLSNPDKELKIIVNPRMGNHPRGFYLIPNKVAVNFIECKIWKNGEMTPNWSKYSDFKQDGIPKDLREFFIET
jgi:hypothetical protein